MNGMVPEACGARARGCGKRAEGCGRLAKEGLEGVEGGGKKTQGERSERKGSGRVRKGGGSGRAGGEMDAEGERAGSGRVWEEGGRVREGGGRVRRPNNKKSVRLFSSLARFYLCWKASWRILERSCIVLGGILAECPKSAHDEACGIFKVHTIYIYIYIYVCEQQVPLRDGPNSSATPATDPG